MRGLLLITLSLSVFAQQAPVGELNRIFVVDPVALHAVEMDGTIAWSVPLAGFPGSTAGTTVDGRGFVWIVDSSGPTAYRYTTAGVLDLTVPISGPLGTVVRMPAVDRVGNCYLSKWVPDSQAPFGYQSHVIKLDPMGNELWDVDLTPELAQSTPPSGLLDILRVDEDQHVWALMQNDPVGVGGRVVRLDPQGNIVSSWGDGGMAGLQLCMNRTLRYARSEVSMPPTTQQVTFGGQPVSQSSSTSTLLHQCLSDPSNELYGVVANGVSGPNPSLVASSLGFEPIPVGPLSGIPGVQGTPGTESAFLAPDGDLWAVVPYPTFGSSGGLVTAWALLQLMPSMSNPLFVTLTPSLATPLFSGFSASSPLFGVMASNRGARCTAYDWCLLVDPWGDRDGDGTLNRNEITSGTNPCDPLSVPGSLTIAGLSLGQTATLTIAAPAEPAATYALMLGPTPSVIPLPDGRAFGPDPFNSLAAWWLAPQNPSATGPVGVLDSAGTAIATLNVPSIPSLVGVSLSWGFATADSAWSLGVRTLHGPVSELIGP